METANITGTGAVSPGFSTESYSPVKISSEPQQVESSEPQRIPEDNIGTNIDVLA